MKKAQFLKAHFVKSALQTEQFPHLPAPRGGYLPEIAIVGRSNVGKSSLINHLLGDKHLAKVSSTPGKTQLLNFFLIDNCLVLVDLPGYGYAKTSKLSKKKWGIAIEDYLRDRVSLELIIFLLDIRRDPTEQDLAFLEWAAHYKKSFFLVFTKCDLISEAEKIRQMEKISHALKDKFQLESLDSMAYTIKNAKSRKEFIHQLYNKIKWV